MPDRLFTDDELAEMARPARDARLVRRYRAYIDGYIDWAATIQAFVAERHGLDGSRAVNAPGDLLEAADAVGLEPGDVELAAETEWSEEVDAACRRVHDTYLDWVAMLLSRIYRTWGVDELEASVRYTGEQTLVGAMPRQLARDADDRIRRTVAGLAGHFSTITVTETDDAVVVVQSPCGSCGRQLQRGRYEPDGPLAVVAEAGPLTFGRGDTPVYRCHVPVMHDLMPRELFGHPWPEIACPPGRQAEGCTVTIRKELHPRAG